MSGARTGGGQGDKQQPRSRSGSHQEAQDARTNA